VIEGYSTSLINLGDGFLLGIGVGESWNSVKVEVYEEDPTAGNGVASVDAWMMENYSYSTEYKSYYIDRANDLVGLPLNESFSGESKYVLLHFDGYQLRPILVLPIWTQASGSRASLEDVRATVIDGYLYVLITDELYVEVVDFSAQAQMGQTALDPDSIEEIARNATGVNHDYVRMAYHHLDKTWIVELWENDAKLPAATVTLDVYGNVLYIRYAE
jgi:uncharacterized secreted protein with C-terminal beta-propeller domain